MDKERQYRNLYAQCQRSDSVCGTVQARTRMLLGDPHQKVSGGTKILADFKEKLNFVALQMVDIFKCHHQDFQIHCRFYR